MSADPPIAYSDTDPAFVYNGAWSPGSWNTADGQSGTLQVTDDLTASVSFAFPVAATAFSVYAVKQLTGGLYSICVDCSPGSQGATNINGELASESGINPPVLLYNLTFPAAGMHTVVLRNLPDPNGMPANSSQLALASFVLAVPSGAQATASITATIISTIFSANASAITPSAVQSNTTTASSTTTTLLNTNNTSASSTSTSTSAPSSTSSTSDTRAPPSSTFSTCMLTTSCASAASSSTPTTPAPSAEVALSPPVPAQAGTVIGATLGALVLMGAFAALVYWRCHWHRGPRVAVTPYTTRLSADTVRAPSFKLAERNSELVKDGAPRSVLRAGSRRGSDALDGSVSPPVGSRVSVHFHRPRVSVAPPASRWSADTASARAPSVELSERKSKVVDDVDVPVRRGDNEDAHASPVSEPPPSYNAPDYSIR